MYVYVYNRYVYVCMTCMYVCKYIRNICIQELVSTAVDFVVFSRRSGDGKETLSRRGSVSMPKGAQALSELAGMLQACRPSTAKALPKMPISKL